MDYWALCLHLNECPYTTSNGLKQSPIKDVKRGNKDGRKYTTKIIVSIRLKLSFQLPRLEIYGLYRCNVVLSHRNWASPLSIERDSMGYKTFTFTVE